MSDIRVKVIAPAGVFIPGLGGREHGESFVFDNESEARELVESYPTRLAMVKPTRTTKASDGDKEGTHGEA